MSVDVLHSGFDGLRMTIQTDIGMELREVLVRAKAEAVRSNRDTVIDISGITFAVRRSGGMGFSVHTGEYGAEWYFLDPENRPANNPGVTVDFRAFLLATGGLDSAQAHLEECMLALNLAYDDKTLRVSRIDFAVDLLAPWFEPDRNALVLPPGTKHREFREHDTTQTFSTNASVMGLTAGRIDNRQLTIYDKRAEILAKLKYGWLTIWNHARQLINLPPLDLKVRDESRVWRFELRLGSKRLRRRWAIHGWEDLRSRIGDVYAEFLREMRYCIQQNDINRSRWSEHELWRRVAEVLSSDLANMRSGADPTEVRRVNRAEHREMLDRLILGTLISRAATDDVTKDNFESFIAGYAGRLITMARNHPVPLQDRLERAQGRYLFQ